MTIYGRRLVTSFITSGHVYLGWLEGFMLFFWDVVFFIFLFFFKTFSSTLHFTKCKHSHQLVSLWGERVSSALGPCQLPLHTQLCAGGCVDANSWVSNVINIMNSPPYLYIAFGHASILTAWKLINLMIFDPTHTNERVTWLWYV